MDKLDILFLDYPISYAKTAAVFGEQLNCTVFNLGKMIKDELDQNSEFAKEIRVFLDAGDFISDVILQKLLTLHLKKLKGKKALLAWFSKPHEDFDAIQKDFETFGVEIGSIWYVSHNNIDGFLKKHIQTPEQKQWIEKFGEDVDRQSINDLYRETKKVLSDFQQSRNDIPWHILEISDESEISAKLDAILKI